MTIAALGTDESKLFGAEVHRIFTKEDSILKKVCRFRNITGAKSYQFPKIAAFEAQQRTLGTNIATNNPASTPVTVTLQEYSAGVYVDKLLDGQVSWHMREEMAGLVAGAMKRKLDQIIIDAYVAYTGSYTNSYTVPSSGDLTFLAFQEAAKALDTTGVPDNDRFSIIHAKGFHSVMGETRASSSDFVSGKSTETGKKPNLYGFDICKMGNNGSLSGLPINGSDVRTNYFVHKMAMGLIMGSDFSVEVNYIPEKASYLVAGLFTAGAGLVDETGVVEVFSDET